MNLTDTEDDVKYWGLNPQQTRRYYLRIAQMRARDFDREVKMYAKRDRILARIERFFFLAAAALLIVSWLGALFGVFVF